jgi:GT2 family glycosyltransferase
MIKYTNSTCPPYNATISTQKYKVILLVPTYNGARNYELFSEWLYRLNPLPDYVIFVENNSNDGTQENIANFKLSHEVITMHFPDDIGKYIESEKWEYTVIAQVRQKLFERAKELDPDYAIFIDDDTLPPHDLIQKVIDAKKNILGGCYYRIFPEGLFLATKFYHPLKEYRDKHSYLLTQREFIYDVDKHSDYYKKKHLIDIPFVEVPMTSGGCLALSRYVLQHPKMRFYPHPMRGDIKAEHLNASEDFGFCLRAIHYGIKVYLHVNIVCRHLFDLRPNPRAWAENQDGKLVTFQWEDKKKEKALQSGKLE